MEIIDPFQKKKNSLLKQLEQQVKRIEKSHLKYLEELENAKKWDKHQHEADLIKAHLHQIKNDAKEIEVHDWQTDEKRIIILDQELSVIKDIEARFTKAKKLKRAIEPLSKQVDKMVIQKEKVLHLIQELDLIQEEEYLEAFARKNYLQTEVKLKQKEEIKPAKPYKEFITETGLKIWVGKSSHENDELTFRHGKGNDYWLHAHGCPGSHVVLHLEGVKEADDQSIKDAALLALYYSKAKNQKEGEVSLTRCKHVVKYGKSAPGKVQISNYKTLYIRLDMDRLKRIQEGFKP